VSKREEETFIYRETIVKYKEGLVKLEEAIGSKMLHLKGKTSLLLYRNLKC
jgi:hypothetical protein